MFQFKTKMLNLIEIWLMLKTKMLKLDEDLVDALKVCNGFVSYIGILN